MSPASSLYLDARLWNPGERRASDPRPLLVRDGRIAWVGEPGERVKVPSRLLEGADAAAPGDAPVRRTGLLPTVSVHELGGRLVTPAFVDAHAHVTMTGQALAGVDLSTAGSLAQALRLIELAAAQTPGTQIYAHSWDETRWPQGRPFTAAELGRAAPGALVYALRVDAHAAVVSGPLADRSGAAAHDGWLGEGLVTRDAHHAVRACWHATVSPQTRRHWIDLALRAAAQAGIGLVHECAAPHLSGQDDLREVLGAASMRTTPLVIGYWGELVEDAATAREMTADLGVRGLAGDLNADGSLGARTACLHEPYSDSPDHRGHAYLDPEQVARHVAACTLAGVQAGFHVIGDGALATVLAGLEQAATEAGLPTGPRHRLEHVEMSTADQARRLAALQVGASMQPAFESAWGGPGGMYAQRLGGRAATTNAWATLLGAGVEVAFGSDSPVTPFAPWEAIRACTTPWHDGQRLDVPTAMGCHTEAGWSLTGLAPGHPARGGRIATGSPADLVVWDADALPALGTAGPAPTAVRTVVRGRVIHDSVIHDREAPLP